MFERRYLQLLCGGHQCFLASEWSPASLLRVRVSGWLHHQHMRRRDSGLRAVHSVVCGRIAGTAPRHRVRHGAADQRGRTSRDGIQLHSSGGVLIHFSSAVGHSLIQRDGSIDISGAGSPVGLLERWERSHDRRATCILSATDAGTRAIYLPHVARIQSHGSHLCHPEYMHAGGTMA